MRDDEANARDVIRVEVICREPEACNAQPGIPDGLDFNLGGGCCGSDFGSCSGVFCFDLEEFLTQRQELGFQFQEGSLEKANILRDQEPELDRGCCRGLPGGADDGLRDELAAAPGGMKFFEDSELVKGSLGEAEGAG